MVKIRVANQLTDLRKLISLGGSNDLCLAIAYVTMNGLNEILTQLEDAIEEKRIKFLVYLDGRITEPAAVRKLVELSVNPHFEVRAFVPIRNNAIFHSKLYISYSDQSITFLTGSYNLTGAALGRNVEFGLQAECDENCKQNCHGRDEHIGCQTLREFDRRWRGTKPLNQHSTLLYEKCYRRNGVGQTDPAAWNDLRKHLQELEDETRFRWPSVRAAYLMGIICAGGSFHFDEGHSRYLIRIVPRLKPGAYKGREVVVHGHGYGVDKVFSQVREHLTRTAMDRFDDVHILETGDLGIEIDCTRQRDAFDKILLAYGYRRKAAGEEKSFRVSSLPSRLLVKRPNKSIVREFIKGYAYASGMVSDNTGKRIWLNTPNNVIHQSLTNLLPVIDVHASAPHGCISISAKAFGAIGFGDFRDDLVSAVAGNKSTNPNQPQLLEQPTSYRP